MSKMQISPTRLKRYLIVLFCLMVGVISCRPIQQPEFRDIQKVSLAQPSDPGQLQLRIVCYNPNNFGAVVKNTACDLYINEKLLGRFVQDSMIRVDKKSEFTMPVSLRLQTANLLSTFLPMAFSGDSVQVRLAGNSQVGKSGVFKNYPISYSGKQDLKGLIR